MKVKNWYKSLLPNGLENMSNPNGGQHKFTLVYGDLTIGILTYAESEWTYAYTDQFQEQSTIRPLLDFPDITRTYTSPYLWPFFALRIPGLGQPAVQKIIAEKEIEQSNIVDLLKEFGQKTIANPFELYPQ
jgi:HipA-like protein